LRELEREIEESAGDARILPGTALEGIIDKNRHFLLSKPTVSPLAGGNGLDIPFSKDPSQVFLYIALHILSGFSSPWVTRLERFASAGLVDLGGTPTAFY
jgi:hypothetical protein